MLSATRTWIIAFFGCFGGAFRIDNGSLLSSYRLVRLCLTNRLLLCRTEDKTQSRSKRDGESDPTNFWAAESRKSGSLPPVLVFSLTRRFFSFNPYLALIEEIAHATGEETGEGGHAERISHILHRASIEFRPYRCLHSL